MQSKMKKGRCVVLAGALAVMLAVPVLAGENENMSENRQTDGYSMVKECPNGTETELPTETEIEPPTETETEPPTETETEPPKETETEAPDTSEPPAEPETETPNQPKPPTGSENNGGAGGSGNMSGAGAGGSAGASGMGNTGEGGRSSKKTLKNAVKKAEEQVRQKEKELESLRTLLNENTLYAKKEGIVSKIDVAKGDTVVPGRQMMVVGETEGKRVLVQAAQNEMRKIKEDQAVEIVFAAYPDQTFSGTVCRKKYQASENGGGDVVFDVEIQIEDTDTELLPGMTCAVSFIEKKLENVLYLSNKVIQMEDGQQFVYVRDLDGNIERRNITCGFSDGRNTEILDGLSEGEIAVIEG